MCPIAERLAVSPALAVEDWLRDGLAANRAARRRGGTAALGAHRADMTLTDVATGTPAALASTGQQKALLIGVILGHAALIAEARGFAPLLLLDEPAVHLDPDRRAALVRGAGAAAGAGDHHRHRRGDVPAARRTTRKAWRAKAGRIAAGPAFSAIGIRPVPLSPDTL